ncbi:MAG: zf-TFIIB domain-containing protein [Magnetococcales bacterium]|nr:zf-TFIIB domain-containing protein [Magnetococcales bacterium]
MPLLVCPNCTVGMLVVQRSGVELDTCPQCRGIWLDRGELEKLLQLIRNQVQEREPSGRGSAEDASLEFRNDTHGRNSVRSGHPGYDHDSSRQYSRGGSHGGSHGGHYKHDHGSSKYYPSDKDKHYRRKNPLESLFDIFD